jgi:hypothetical protein
MSLDLPLFTVDAIDLGIIRINKQYGSNEWDANQMALRIIWSDLIKIYSTKFMPNHCNSFEL